jgi:hypothetical protein
MNRTITYPGALPKSADFLNAQRNAMIAAGAILQAVFGTSQIASGFTCAQLPVPGMGVQVSAGALTQYTTVDATAYGELAAELTEYCVKQGINLDAITLNIAAPGTAGQSIAYLIEAAFAEIDGAAVVLPYVNAANPSQPYAGPTNSGAAQNTTRTQSVTLTAKAGSAAATGSQATPAVDTGYVPLFVVTVAYGQTAITTANIATHPSAPFVKIPLQSLTNAAGGNVTTVTASTTLTANNAGQVSVNAASGNITITRPLAASANGVPLPLEYIRTDTSANTVTIVCAGSDTTWPSGATSTTLAPQSVLTEDGDGVSVWRQTGGQTIGGQCRLSAQSTTSLLLAPYNGNNVIVNGAALQIPSAGISVSNSGLAASTLYYVYLGGTTAVPTLTLSTTGHTAQANGITTMTGNTALSLVGMVYTNTSSQFSDTAALRGVANWFNRVTKYFQGSTLGGSTTSTTQTELNSAYRAVFLAWSDEAISAQVQGVAYNNTAAQSVNIQVGIDNAPVGGYGQMYSAVAGQTSGLIGTYNGNLTDGAHTAMVLVAVSAGSGGFNSGFVGGVTVI